MIKAELFDPVLSFFYRSEAATPSSVEYIYRLCTKAYFTSSKIDFHKYSFAKFIEFKFKVLN